MGRGPVWNATLDPKEQLCISFRYISKQHEALIEVRVGGGGEEHCGIVLVEFVDKWSEWLLFFTFTFF